MEQGSGVLEERNESIFHIKECGSLWPEEGVNLPDGVFQEEQQNYLYHMLF